DVLYQLSYCGGPCGRAHLIPGTTRIGKVDRPQMTGSPAPAGQEAAPAAGLRLRRTDLFRKFIAWLFLVDSWIIRWPDNRDHGRDRRSIRFAELGAGTEQRRCRDVRRFGWRRGRLGGRCRRWLGGCRGRRIGFGRRWGRE